MLKNHPLFVLSHGFIPHTPNDNPQWKYRRDIGAWVESNCQDVLMVRTETNDPSRPPKPKPTTEPRPQPPVSKKMDVETGEDMKGA